MNISNCSHTFHTTTMMSSHNTVKLREWDAENEFCSTKFKEKVL